MMKAAVPSGTALPASWPDRIVIFIELPLVRPEHVDGSLHGVVARCLFVATLVSLHCRAFRGANAGEREVLGREPTRRTGRGGATRHRSEGLMSPVAEGALTDELVATPWWSDEMRGGRGNPRARLRVRHDRRRARVVRRRRHAEDRRGQPVAHARPQSARVSVRDLPIPDPQLADPRRRTPALGLERRDGLRLGLAGIRSA